MIEDIDTAWSLLERPKATWMTPISSNKTTTFATGQLHVPQLDITNNNDCNNSMPDYLTQCNYAIVSSSNAKIAFVSVVCRTTPAFATWKYSR